MTKSTCLANKRTGKICTSIRRQTSYTRCHLPFATDSYILIKTALATR